MSVGMTTQGAVVATVPPMIMVAAGYSDWQVLAILSIALLVAVYRVVIADPPMPMRLAIATTLMGFGITIFLSPIFGRFIGRQLGISEPDGAIIAAFIIAIGWTKLYKTVENSLVDTLLNAIMRAIKAFFGGDTK